MLFDVEFQKFPMQAIGLAIRVIRVRMRPVVLFGGQQLPIVALLEFYHVDPAELRRDLDHLKRRLEISTVVAADLADHHGFVHPWVLCLYAV
jgi:hypothetical protein